MAVLECRSRSRVSTNLILKKNLSCSGIIKNEVKYSSIQSLLRVILICLLALTECMKTLKSHVTRLWRDPEGSCRPSEVNSAVIQKTATRRSKQTAQHKQHPINTNRAPLTGSHQQGGSESGGTERSADRWLKPCGIPREDALQVRNAPFPPKSLFFFVFFF